MGIPFFGFDIDDEPNDDELADLEVGIDETSSDWSDSADDISLPSDFDF